MGQFRACDEPIQILSVRCTTDHMDGVSEIEYLANTVSTHGKGTGAEGETIRSPRRRVRRYDTTGREELGYIGRCTCLLRSHDRVLFPRGSSHETARCFAGPGWDWSFMGSAPSACSYSNELRMV